MIKSIVPNIASYNTLSIHASSTIQWYYIFCLNCKILDFQVASLWIFNIG